MQPPTKAEFEKAVTAAQIKHPEIAQAAIEAAGAVASERAKVAGDLGSLVTAQLNATGEQAALDRTLYPDKYSGGNPLDQIDNPEMKVAPSPLPMTARPVSMAF